jgi:hypothetical protein
MNVHLTIEPPDTLVVHLQEGREATTVAARPVHAGVQSFRRALEDALRDGYGECFWPGVTGGQYWWMFKRVDEALEVVAMWTRGGASSWQHVFRATDAAIWIRERWESEVERLKQAGP